MLPINPAFFTIGSISAGAQAGGKEGLVAMFLMTDKAVSSFTQYNNFSLNGNAGLSIVNWSPNAQGSIGKGDVVVWSGQTGLYAGLNINGSDIVADTSENQSFYNNKQAATEQIIANQFNNPSARAEICAAELSGELSGVLSGMTNKNKRKGS